MIVLRKLLIAIAGGVLLIAGVAMIILPGPAFVVIPAALAILAIEFVWARRWLAWVRARLKALASNKSSGESGQNRNSRMAQHTLPP
jgi:tellurite resistance protein TerC